MGLVGIVLVSHSEQLASGLRELLRQVATPEVRIEPAGGTDDGELGTSPSRIAAAIETADTGAGVVVLADLGSAVLTARAVLADTPGPELVDAPFVEGAVAAAVTASTGADLAAVVEAAREARDVPKF
ncbi:dihydroxyacetone kinase phosphoryl donor subunit DhaM [Actinoplanes regularis]|uniref:phosphoenolpyruvate--glycerone phosphotransferase n=1 Tax=Actinoplanes regularis TaxID=52697 RepID=A0A238ZNY6_9ACTN|nr:dihydroxyacetone kinase phosphoryl donor subunit DhaM [Actinoplanes regularis]GIE87551.1 PTS fructose transporter subunit IIA [Actinoplanes regularis]SNR84872.1 dihydroxyacetone kinase, phosphotransfer subunit [Actinoplanes regularis]